MGTLRFTTPYMARLCEGSEAIQRPFAMPRWVTGLLSYARNDELVGLMKYQGLYPKLGQVERVVALTQVVHTRVYVAEGQIYRVVPLMSRQATKAA